jgi:DNA-binding protein H-NS
MRRFLTLLMLAASLVALSEALPVGVDTNKAKISHSSAARSDTYQSNRSLRVVDATEDEESNDEERGVLSDKALMKLSKAAKKFKLNKTAKNLEHRAWLAAGESPQTMARKYKWTGKSLEELKKDPTYIYYQGFDELWQRAQYRKGTMMTPDEWVLDFQR